MEPHSRQDGHAWLAAHLFFNGDIYREVGDRVIGEVVGPLVEASRGEVARWFFLRYQEEGPHVRLRFHAPPEVLEDRLRSRIARAAEASELVERLAFRPYEPEVERYGGPWGVRLAEDLFRDSSESALALLAKVRPGERPGRLGKALLTMLVQLYLYEGTREPAAELARRYGATYLYAWAPEPEQQKRRLAAFNEGFDRQADRLADYVEAAWEALEKGETLTAELDLYRKKMFGIARRLRSLFEEGRLSSGSEVLTDWTASRRRIVPSYLHMMNNRLGVSTLEESYLSVLISKTLDPSGSDDAGQLG